MSLWVLWQATKLPTFSVFGPGPEFMPNVLAISLLALSVLLFVSTLRKAAVGSEDLMPDRQAIFRIVAIIVSLLLYVALLDKVGYLILTFAYSLFMLVALGKYRWHTNALIAVAITGFFYWTFVMVLGVPAPEGIFSL